MSNEIALSERLKKLRGEKTQKEFADFLGMSSRSIISDWEDGKHSPDLTTLIKIADEFRVSLDWLTGRSGYALQGMEDFALFIHELVTKKEARLKITVEDNFTNDVEMDKK